MPRFNCGNFGLLLLKLENACYVERVLRRMVQVTMIRGAQAGGIVTYVPGSNSHETHGVRVRVVKGMEEDDEQCLLISQGVVDGKCVSGSLCREALGSANHASWKDEDGAEEATTPIMRGLFGR